MSHLAWLVSHFPSPNSASPINPRPPRSHFRLDSHSMVLLVNFYYYFAVVAASTDTDNHCHLLSANLSQSRSNRCSTNPIRKRKNCYRTMPTNDRVRWSLQKRNVKIFPHRIIHSDQVFILQAFKYNKRGITNTKTQITEANIAALVRYRTMP